MSMTVAMDDLLQIMVDEAGSDLHLRVGVPPVIRLHGRLVQLDMPSLTPDDTESLMKAITSESHIQKVREFGGTDFGFAFGDQARFRVSVFREKGQHGLVLRQIPNKLLTLDDPAVKATEQSVSDQIGRLFAIQGKQTPDYFHRELGKVMWEYSGMGRNEAGLKKALELIPQIREEFWNNLRLPGTGEEVNQSLEMAGRVADFLELGELLCLDALNRRESCGAHFREEWQTGEGEAMRDDESFCHVAAWEYQGEGSAPVRHTEQLAFESLHLATRNYK